MLILALACSHSDDVTESETDETEVVETDDTDVVDESLDPDAVAAVLGEAERSMRREAKLATGAQIAIWRDGRVYYVGSVGAANQEGTRLIDEDTLFQVGSDTKKLTADRLQTRRSNMRWSRPGPSGTPAWTSLPWCHTAKGARSRRLISPRGSERSC